jgi:YidC/Oxa1 family membrane protein insertase
MSDQRNTFVALGLSVVVLVGWQYFVGFPEAEKQRRLTEMGNTPVAAGAPSFSGQSTANAPSAQGVAVAPNAQAAASRTPRIKLDTPKLEGSISLLGGRLDDLKLKAYRETVDPMSKNISLLAPSGSENPFYGEFGWVGSDASVQGVPQSQTLWSVESGSVLAPSQDVVLVHKAGNLTFRRTVSIDDKYMFTIKDSVTNSGQSPVKLHPYALVSRHGSPSTLGLYVIHEGLIGALGDEGLQEYSYKTIDSDKLKTWRVQGGFVGITDKYWAAAIIPDQSRAYEGRFVAGLAGDKKTYQADYLLGGIDVAAGETTSVTHHMFAGAKEVKIVEQYGKDLGIKRFDLLIDWGWFYFFTKPLFYLLDYFYHLFGNFGLSILFVTVLVKLAFFPLANKSYISMSKMKKVQPQMVSIRERFKDDKLKQQQEMMELYKREKINPAAGCLPVLLQIPVFFALYKVLFVSIEMRHAPFYGWIKDLAGPDPTSLFNLFGLLPYEVPTVLLIGVWPLLMGLTSFVQMQMNPQPEDPTQKMLFTWMPIFFMFLMASFPAGLVIYWTWSNLLSILQQWYIMNKQGVRIELFDNIAALFKRKPSGASS